MSVIRLGDVLPNFEADTTIGHIKFHDWLEGSWAILFSHPRDYTPVCTTELSHVIELKDEFAKRGIKLMALSCDSLEDHRGWSKDILAYCGCKDKEVPFGMIADPERKIAKLLGMIDPDEKDLTGMPTTCRAALGKGFADGGLGYSDIAGGCEGLSVDSFNVSKFGLKWIIAPLVCFIFFFVNCCRSVFDE